MAMGSLAGMLKASGYDVRGSDQQMYPPMSDQLAQLTIPCFEGFREENLDWQPDMVVVGNVITRQNPEAIALNKRSLPYTSLPKLLAEFFIQDRHSVVVTGTHGKTTTSGILAWTLVQSGRDPGFLIGGVLKNFGATYRVGNGDIFVVEGDEYDTAYFDKVPKFVHYRPTTGIITSVEFDHADIYEDLARIQREFQKFTQLIPANGLLVACVDDPNVRELITTAPSPVQTYGYSPDAEWTITDISTANDTTAFTVSHHTHQFGRFHTAMIGRHNLLNMLGATAILAECGLSPEEIDRGFRTFKGVKRRQEIRGIVNGIVVLDDFAHHPTAVKATVEAVKRHYHGHALWSVFEPRTATTRRDVFQQEYANAFTGTDAAIITDVDRPEKAPEGQRFSSERLVRDLKQQGIDAHHISGVDAIVAYLTLHLQPGDVVLIMSNGGFGGIHQKLLDALESASRGQQEAGASWEYVPKQELGNEGLA